MKVIYYKAVSKRDGKLYSFNYFRDCLDGTCIEYKIGEWTAPIIKSSKLFVFDTKEAAIKSGFLSLVRDYPLFECEVEGEPINLRKVESIPGRYSKFWQTGKLCASRVCPLGTLLVDRVRLVKEVS